MAWWSGEWAIADAECESGSESDRDADAYYKSHTNARANRVAYSSSNSIGLYDDS